MARYTSAYSPLTIRLEEVTALSDVAKKLTRQRPTQKNISAASAVCRGGIVLLSSHIEGYIEDLAEVILKRIYDRGMDKASLGPKFRYHFSKDLLRELSLLSDPEKVSLKLQTLMDRDSDIWSTESKFTRDLPSGVFVKGFSTPGYVKIKKFIGRFGYVSYSSDMSGLLRTKYDPCRNMVDNVVEQRNKIAHGDAILTCTPTDV